MAEMALGYGSEYQLLRFLGHHRNFLNNEILKQTGIEGVIEWEDYPSDSKRLSLDGEFKGIEFLKNYPDYASIKAKWKNFWPQSGNSQNWDGIFYCNKVIYLVEAKAHLETNSLKSELESDCGAENADSKKHIDEAFEKTREFFGIKAVNDWTKKYYQQANRLAFIYFLNEICGIKAELVNIFFINGYDTKENDYGVTSEAEWKAAIKDEYDYLGLTDRAKFVIHEVFIDCKCKLY